MTRTMPKVFAIALVLAMVFSFLPEQTQTAQAVFLTKSTT